MLLMGGDSGCYARIARELAERPLFDFTTITLGGEPFFEHPPLALWVESLAFRAFGASVDTAVVLARVWASLALLLIGIAAWELGARRLRMIDGIEGPTLGAFAMLGTLSLPGFLHESQVAMLETPLVAFTALGAWALAGLFVSRAPYGDRLPTGALWTFALATTLAFWVKGPPAFLLVGAVLALAAFKLVPRRHATLATLGSLTLTFVTARAFDGLRALRGQGSYFGHYFGGQVLDSLTHGHHHYDPNPLYYVPALRDWYLPALLAVPVLVAVPLLRRKRPWTWRLLPEQALLGGLLFGGVVVGFSVMPQKYPWYMHLGIVGGGLMVGAALALLPPRVEPWLRALVLFVAAGWPLVAQVDRPLSVAQSAVWAVQHTPAPEGVVRTVADCSQMEAWASRHLIGFAWRAERVACDAPATFVWDGQHLQARPAP